MLSSSRIWILALGNDPCSEVGGFTYDGDTGVANAGSCTEVETVSEGITQLSTATNADDPPVSEEVTVYGSTDCDMQVVTASDNMCVIVS